ncbi:polyprotein [Phanerochaete sordida]|uniref:RNA-directed DNA polymerase n=1 Tax=Phanerochaete sordida TaxID=48140 RepID=A0A9P3GP63_9APHY|nr:polyprotein [Phanerochaete sordida]
MVWSRELHKDLVLNDTTKIDYFYSGLKEDLKDLLVGKLRPTSFDAFARLCTELDDRLHERELEKKESSKGSSSSRSDSKPRPRPAAYPAAHAAAPAVASSSSQVVPMEIDAVKRGPLSAAEKDRRRREGLCLYCGQGKHMIADCPNIKPVRTFALIDSGASGSCISEAFARRHSLPRRLKDVPTPVTAVDDRPIASGLVIHDVVTQLTVDKHSEVISLGVVSVSYPIILGLDWLRRHNPVIDWETIDLSLSCCNLTRSTRITVPGKGFGLPRPFASLNSFTSVGLGFGLNGGSVESRLATSPAPTPHERSASASTPSPPPTPCSPFLSLFLAWNGFGRSAAQDSSFSTPQTSPPDIAVVNPRRFLKYTKSTPYALIRFHATGSPSYKLAMMSGSTPTSDLDLDDPEPSTSPDVEADVLADLPPKYHPWASVFSPVDVDQLPPHRPYDISIELEDGKSPPFGTMYRLSPEERTALAEYIESNLKKGFIRRSTSSAAAPILFVRKKTGGLRLCVDYRGLNAISKKNRYPLPLIDDLLDRVQGCSRFSVIDLKNAFNLVRVKEGDEWKTAFRTPLGLYEYLVMPFGLSNAPATFQAFIQDTLRDYLDVFCVVYLDDILIFSRTQEEHDQHVMKVLDRLKSAQLYANAEKCEFDRSEVTYLGYLLGADGIRMDPKKLDTVASWPEPQNVKDVQSFLGFTNFYRRFVDNYARIVLPLNTLTRKDTPFSFSSACRDAFNALKKALLSYPVLRHFDAARPCTLCTDASDFAISGVLQQPDDLGLLHPVGYYSRKLTPAEINYEVYDKELLAVVESFRDMRAWLHGSTPPVSVISDHKNLEYFMSSRVLNRRQARWSMFLSEFNFHLVWGPGLKNVADPPSRRPDFAPRKGDDVLEEQRQTLLTPEHTKLRFLNL